MGDIELIKELIPVFLEDCQERFEKLKTAVLDKDCEAIRFYAHAVKGAAGNVGAQLFSDAAGKLENASKNGDIESAVTIYGELKTEYGKVVLFLSRPDCFQNAYNNGQKDNIPLINS